MFKINGSLSIRAIQKPEVVISERALQKMELYVKECSEEIGWLGTVVKNGNWYFIQDVFLFEQEVHGATCELSEQSIASWTEDMLINHPDGMDIVNSMKMWGHSHVNMQVSPSGQDEKQFEELAKNSDDFFIRIIANKSGELRVDFWDKQLNILYNCIQWHKEMIPCIDVEAIKLEIKEKVKKKVYATTSYMGYTKGNTEQAQRYMQYDIYGNIKEEKKEKRQAQTQYTYQTYQEFSMMDIVDSKELIAELGLTEDDVIGMACLTPMEIQNELSKWWDDITFLEAKHIKMLCEEHVIKNYGSVENIR